MFLASVLVICAILPSDSTSSFTLLPTPSPSTPGSPWQVFSVVKRCYTVDVTVSYVIPGGISSLTEDFIRTTYEPLLETAKSLVPSCSSVTFSLEQITFTPPGQSNIGIDSSILVTANSSMSDEEIATTLPLCISLIRLSVNSAVLNSSIPMLVGDDEVTYSATSFTIGNEDSCCEADLPPCTVMVSSFIGTLRTSTEEDSTSSFTLLPTPSPSTPGPTSSSIVIRTSSPSFSDSSRNSSPPETQSSNSTSSFTLLPTPSPSTPDRPQFSTHPQNVTEKEGYNASLSCYATGNPIPTILWTKGGSHINADADSRVRISEDGTQLTITTVTREDDGQYQCVAHNGCGNSTSDPATLTVQYRPEFNTHPQNVTGKEGYNVSLSCYATGNPIPTILWTKGGSHINADADSRVRISEDGTQLTITTVTREDDGQYQCVAHNGCGNSTSDPATLTVQYRPEFSTHPQNVTEKEGYNASLSCYATGNPTPAKIWTKGGSHINADADSRVRISEDGTQLTITTVTREDDGQYQCVAHNGCGNSTSDPATLTVQYRPEFNTHPQNVTEKEGYNVSLSCYATGNPTPTILWTKGGSHINADADSRVRISGDGTQLTITTVTREDDGQYQCVAHNGCGNSTSDPATLTVQYRPEFSTHPQNVTKKEGNSVSLSCYATGNPTPAIIWTKGGSHINADGESRARISGDGTQLTITTVTREDDGQYQCVAHNSCGNSTSDPATLTVQYRPEFSTHPQNVTKKEGNSVSLSCYATGNPTPAKIWTKGGSHINADGESRVRISGDGTQLTITTVTREDDGQYQCVAHNSCGNSTSDPATLTAQYRPEFSTHPQNVTKKEGNSVSLSCYATGNPTPAIIWTKGGSHINADGESRVRISEDGTQLTITTVTREDDGQYQCVAYNSCGNSTSDPATLTVQSACHEDILYPFGPEQKDNELHLSDSLYHSYHYCLKIFTDRAGFLFSEKRHYKLHICRNGVIQLNYEWMWWWPYKFGVYRWLRDMPVIAPFWAPIDDFWAFETGHSKVFYQVYSRQINGVSKGSVNADIMKMASQHVRKYHKDINFATFEATWVLVVTWQNLSPYSWYGYDFYLNYKPRVCPSGLFNTFQAVIITNGFNTFLMYNYPYGHIKWVAPTLLSHITHWTSFEGLPVAGWNAGNEKKESYENIDRSGTVEMLAIDKTVGNTGLNGRYFWRIENGDANDALVKCYSWADQQTNSNFLSLYYDIRNIMPCPCSMRQAFFDRRFIIDWSTWSNLCAYSRRRIYLYLPIFNRQLQIESYELVYLTQQCCYSEEFETWGALKQGSPDGSRILVNFLGHVNNPQVEFYSDSEAYKLCCVDSPLCDFFYYFRPSDDCSHYEPPIIRWFWGDPHIKTLDGKNYTFNGLGEYVMLDGQDGLFQLQARTSLAQGNSTKATIFSAGAAKEENTSTIEVRVKDGGGLHILINGSAYDDFASPTNQSVEINGSIYLSKPEENCVESSFPSTTSITFCEAKGMLSFVVTPSDNFNNATKGLLGTWNDDPDDDFTLPDGMVLPASSTLEQIHFGFGVKWQINSSQSLFTYDQGEDVSTFTDPSFEPMFADNITWANDSLRMAAEEQCGEDYECLFDVASTNDLSVGAVTKNINIQLVNETNQLENFPPKIVYAPSVINATFGEVVEVSITAEDNDTITFQVINKPAGATVNTTGDILYFTWPVNSTQKFNLSFVVADESGAKTNWRPTINMCACLHGGQCVPPEQGDELNTDSKFVYLGCACQGGYTGRFCDSDIDACESNGQPCYEGVECTDLPPPANTTGYKCGPCPSGYTGDGAQCADFDECQNNANNNCGQVCVNIPASFVCECNDGYQLNADGHSCNDIDECYPSSDCWQQCVNSVGSYNCSCDQYFTKDPADWKNCLPEKSCSADYGCSQGCYEGENNEPLCSCDGGYLLESDGKTCTDIDECDPDDPLHRCNQICKNTPGSYQCECLDGFELNKDGFECEDINECLDIDSFNCTDEFHRCVNTRGAYKCECEPGLYWIDGKCRGLEKNETAPIPEVPKPREPSQKEEEEAAELSFSSGLHWNFTKDKDFKEKMASLATSYCTNNRTKCGLKERRLKRRSLGLDSYAADQVHLLPGYPKNTSRFLLVAFYVQHPPGIIADVDAIPASTLVEIVNTHKSEIEEAVGASISNVQALFGPTTASTTKPTEETKKQSSDDWKWIAIGVSVGVVVIILIIVLAYWCKNKERAQPEWKVPKEPRDHMNMVYYNTYNLEQGSGSLPDVQSSL